MLSVTSYGLVIDNVTVEFNRNLKQGTTEETIEGILYCQPPEEVLVSVRKPLTQWISFKNAAIEIYYPEDSIAFKIISNYPVSFSFFGTFLNVVKEDFGLSDRGYSMLKHKIENDTLITYWSPPSFLSETIDNLRLVYIDNRISSSEVKRINGELMLKSSYEKHFQYGEYCFPMEINTEIYIGEDTIFEKILYKNPVFNDSLPDEIENFHIPKGIEVEEVGW